MIRWLILAVLAVLATPAHAQDQATVVSSCGSVTLKAGTSSFRTIDLNGVTCNSGGAGGGTATCAESTAYLARTVGGIEGGNASAIANLVCGLVTDGVWSKLDALYVLAQQNATDAKLNLVGTNYTIPANGATFTPYRGYSAFPASIDTGFNPATPGTKFNSNPGSITSWAYDAPGNSQAQLGTSTSPGVTYMLAKYGTQILCTINAGGDSPATTPGLPGIYGCDRMTPSTIDYFFEGKDFSTQGASSVAPASVDIYLGGVNVTYFVTTTISEASIGGSLGLVGQAALSARMHTYMASAGGGCSAATAYLTRAPGETTHASDLTKMICGLVADGVWSKLDALYLFAQQTAADAKLNLIGTSYTLPTNTASFTPFVGYSVLGPGIDTGFNMVTSPSPHLTQNNGAIHVWNYNAPDTGTQLGTGTDVSDTALTSNYVNTFTCYISVATAGNGTLTPRTSGFYGCDRSSPTLTTFYFGGSSIWSNANPTMTPRNIDMLIGYPSPSSTGPPLAEVDFGGSLGDAGNLALYNRLHTYMVAVGWTGATSRPGAKPPTEPEPKK